uniref:Ig-like domain-containing protein n=1 Tax=Periophthalmus magnuspinnatus TaxID=409849 RepID=A0A3B4AQI2_9GOBI
MQRWHQRGSRRCSRFLQISYLCLTISLAAPVFLTELQTQDVPDGYPVSFDCVVIGKPAPAVKWYKDGKLLEENDHYMINEDQEGCHQLIITSVLPSDMGVYRCTAENSSGITATKAELRVDGQIHRGLHLHCYKQGRAVYLHSSPGGGSQYV